jgi:hypothetical protein
LKALVVRKCFEIANDPERVAAQELQMEELKGTS